MSSHVNYATMKPWKRMLIGCTECFCAGAFMVQALRSILNASLALSGGRVTIHTTDGKYDGEREID